MQVSAEWSRVQTDWAALQTEGGIPTIEQTVKAKTPSGLSVEANRFDFNIAFACDRYVRCTNGSWIKARALLPRLN